jgi:hypothetical protein
MFSEKEVFLMRKYLNVEISKTIANIKFLTIQKRKFFKGLVNMPKEHTI